MKNEPKEKLCSHEQIKHFYDRLGGWLDTQRFFKAPALKRLIEYSDFEHARYVCELGCGTGRLAERILLSNSELIYHGTDLSSTMVKLAQARLQRFGGRATVVLADSTGGIELSNGAADRFVSTYVFDLMATIEIQSLLAEAYRILDEEGKLCLVSLTNTKQSSVECLLLCGHEFIKSIPSLWAVAGPLSSLNSSGKQNGECFTLVRRLDSD